MKRRSLALFLPLAMTALTGCGYNTIQTYDEQANEAKSRIQVQLQRRADLVPNLVNTVKGYAQHEETIFTNVANARSRLLSSVQSGDPSQMAAANQDLSGALGRLLAIQENYPQLKADQGFLRLQDELTGTENRIAVARNDYNDAARQYNTYIRQFPTAVTAKVISAREKPYFEVTDASKLQPPTVDFSRPPAQQPPAATKVP
jgi:LemA protein